MASGEVNFTIPQGVQNICKILSQHGEDGFLVGGCLRDLLRGKEPDDWDLATSATPKKIMKLFRRVIPTGIAHGTVTILIGDESFEITTLRSEQGYSDGRHPDSVRFVTNIEDDLSRRDFTVNAMAWNPLTQTLCDPFDGQGDIERRLLRAVGDARHRFEEDGLRIMRAARFAATLQFEIEDATLEAMSEKVERLLSVSAERKRDELMKLLCARIPSFGLQVLSRQRILQHFSPLLFGLALSGRWQTVTRVVDELPPVWHLRLCGLLMDLSESERNFWMDENLIDRRTKKQVDAVCAHLPLPYQAEWTDSQVRQLAANVRREHFGDYLIVAGAVAKVDSVVDNRFASLVQRLSDSQLLQGALSIGELAVGGTELLKELGMTPGREVGQLLAELLEVVIDNPALNTRPQLLAIAERIRPGMAAGGHK